MRWEPAAVACLLGFWANSLWSIARVRDGGPYWWWDDLLWTLPWLALGPAFAVSGLRHPGTSRGWRVVAGGVLVLWMVSPQTWAVLGYLWWVVG